MAEVNGASTASPQPLATASQPQPLATSTPTAQAASAPAESAPSAKLEPLPAHPTVSAADGGSGTRPRDARTVHMILSAMGVQSYHERVPLQLLDFAYRYTAGILSDAQHLSLEGYTAGSTTTGGRGSAAHEEIGLSAIRLAASSRPGYQFIGGQLPKESLLEMATERNKSRLPPIDPDGVRFGLRLPQERFLLNGRGWGLKDEWESEVEDDEGDEPAGDVGAGGVDHEMADDGEPDGEDETRMEDVFGDDDKMEE